MSLRDKKSDMIPCVYPCNLAMVFTLWFLREQPVVTVPKLQALFIFTLPVSCRALPLWEEEMSLVNPDWFHSSSSRQKRAYQTLASRGQLADPQTTCHIQKIREP
jgi:hypothetical protein